ncbi:MAG: hypothetical protein CMJ47_13330 [Planctomyces sp.]|nr:hypothetical protein [Planctomyces sp.]
MNRRKRARRRKAKLRRARMWPRIEWGTPSEYLGHAERWWSFSNAGAVVIYCRVSTGKQDRNNNYAWQKQYLEHFCKREGISVLKRFCECANGNGTSAESRPKLARAISFAQETDVPILAASTDRYLRPKDFSKFDQSAPPLKTDFEQLRRFASGAMLLTLLNPDADWREVKSMQRTMSLQCPKPQPKKQAVPRTRKERREMLADEVRYLNRAGLSSREIQDELMARKPYRVPSHKTIWQWLQNRNY